MSETCASCKWWVSDGSTNEGACYRFPPTPFNGFTRGVWPTVPRHAFCGEHQPREVKPEKPKAREPGPYWVSPKGWHNWVVAHASIQPGTWFLPGEEAPVGDEDMLEIDERRIVRDAGS